MLEFQIENDIDYQGIINQLMVATKLIAQIYNQDEKKGLQKTLMEILVNDNYCFITRKHGQRDMIIKYSKDDIFNTIVFLLKKYNLSNYLMKKENKYQINTQYIISFIKQVCIDELFDKLDKTFVKVQNEKTYEPQNIKFYSPSEKLKASINNGDQTKVSNSSYSFNSMYAYSDVGRKRNNQEDSYYIGVHPQNPNFRIMMVADGMGGYDNGEIASNIAVKELMKWFDSLNGWEFYNKDNYQLKINLTDKINEINNKICQSVNSGGTTLCLAIIKNNSIMMCNIGDSQGYIFENNALKYETSPDNVTNTPSIPKEVARFHKDNNVIKKYLGNPYRQDIEPRIEEYKLSQLRMYKVVLCSDGVTDCLSRRNIIEIVNSNDTDNISKALVELAIYNKSSLKEEINFLNAYQQQQVYMLKEEFYDEIMGGKDNTTAISGIIRR